LQLRKYCVWVNKLGRPDAALHTFRLPRGSCRYREDAFAQGVAVCLVLDEPGETPTDVATQVIGMHPTWNRIDAQHFVGAAEERYCPDKLPRRAQHPVCSADKTSAASFETVDLRDDNRQPRSEAAPRDYDIAYPDAPYEVLR